MFFELNGLNRPQLLLAVYIQSSHLVYGCCTSEPFHGGDFGGGSAWSELPVNMFCPVHAIDSFYQSIAVTDSLAANIGLYSSLFHCRLGEPVPHIK